MHTEPVKIPSIESPVQVYFVYNKNTTPCLKKKLCQLIFCSLSVKCKPISIKIGRIVPEETLKETVPKLATSPKVCACTTLGPLKCQIEPSTQ